MLIKSLRNCFSANKNFAKLSIPLFIEKIESNLEDSQIDAMETYAQCAKTTYDPNLYREYIEKLWDLFIKMIMNASKTNVETAALKAIEALSANISTSIQHSDSSADTKSVNKHVSIEWFVQKAVDACLDYLNEPDLKLIWPNIKCLQAVASASSTANLLINKNSIPYLIKCYNSTTFVSLLSLFNFFFYFLSGKWIYVVFLILNLIKAKSQEDLHRNNLAIFR